MKYMSRHDFQSIIPEGFHEINLGDLITFQRGHDLPKKKRKKGSYPVVASNGIVGFHNEFKVKGPGVIVGRSGNIGEPYYINKNYWPLNTTLYVKEFKSTSPEFVYYFLKSINLGRYNSGSAVPSLNRNYIHPLKIKVPKSITYQNKIASLLSTLDDKIELNRRMNVTLEQIAQAIFKQWFIDFEFPDENGQPYKSSGGEMVESGLGEIPRGWEVKELKDVCSKICNGGTPARKKKEYWENGTIPWIKTKELCDTIILNSEEKITQEGLDNSAAKLLGPNTVIIAIYASPTVGRLGVVGTHAATNQACTALIADESQYSHYHIFYSLLFLRDHLNNLASGSAQQNISKSIIEKQNILLPPKELLDKSTIGFSNIWKLIENNLWEINYLTQLRDSLLPKLMSGNLRCGVVKRMLEGKT
jgi:type I restriction enzyme S subunit